MEVEDCGNPSFQIVMDSILARQSVSKEESQVNHLKKQLAIAQKQIHELVESIAELKAARRK